MRRPWDERAGAWITGLELGGAEDEWMVLGRASGGSFPCEVTAIDLFLAFRASRRITSTDRIRFIVDSEGFFAWPLAL